MDAVGSTPIRQEARDEPVVGRGPERALLHAALDAARAGRGRLVLVGGEPGIGKTHLVGALVADAAATGVAAAWASCWAGGGAPAFWPWVQLVRALAAGCDDAALRRALGAGAEDVTRLVPELAARLGTEPAGPLPPGQSPFRIFDAVAGFVVAAADPVLLVLDDLQWADPSTVGLLHFLAARLPQAPVLVVGTFRDDEVGGTHPLAAVRRGLTSDHDQLTLSGLTVDEVGRFVAALTGHATDPAAAATLHRRTDGNPFFARELVRLGDGGRAGLPDGVRDATRRRLDQRTPPCRALLATAAVLGEEFDGDRLAAVAGLDPGACADLLAEAAGAHLVEVRDGTHRFVHALVREVLYDGSDPAARRTAHRRCAEALRGQGGEHDAELAHHLARAVPDVAAAEAVTVARRAGELALGRLAHAEAAGLFTTALDLVDRLDEERDRVRAEVLVQLGTARRAAGDLEQARAAFAAAADAARVVRATAPFVAAALGLGTDFAVGGLDELEIRLLEEALDLLPDGDGTPRARVLARLARALHLAPHPARRLALADEAVAVATRLDDPGVLADVLFDRMTAAWGHLPAAERLAVTDAVERAAARAGDVALRMQARLLRVGGLLELADVAAARAELDAVEQAVATLRQPQFGWQTVLVRACLATLEDRFDDAERLIGEAAAAGAATGHPSTPGFVLATSCAVLLTRGRGEFAVGLAGNADRFAGMPVWGAALALGLLMTDRAVEARATYERLAARNFTDLPRDYTFVTALALLADVCHLLGDRARAGALRDLLAPSGGHLARLSRTGSACLGPVDHHIGLLELTLGNPAAAVDRLTAAVVCATRIGSGAHRAHAQQALAAALRARGADGDLDDAVRHAGEAAAAAERLGVRLAPTPETPAGPAPAAGRAPAPGGPVFVRSGEYWTVGLDHASVRLRHSVGLAHLARLLAEPGRELAAVDLTGSRGAGGDAGPLLDDTARRAYRRRMHELAAELDEADRWADPERSARARAELDALAAQLAGAVGLGGRARVAGSAAERARVTVTKAVKAALKRLGEQDPELGAYLARTVRTGTYCCYTGDLRFRVSG